MTPILDIDLAVFRWFNQTLVNPAFDVLMPFLSGNIYFVPLVIIGLLTLAWRGGRRGRCFVFLLLFTIAIGETGITSTLKKTFRRPRPFVDHPETRLLVGRGRSFAMPSGHSALWAAAAMVTALMYRRRAPAVAALATGVGISRMYVGVHYPTDVLAGWLLGAGYGWLLPHLTDRVWGAAGRRWFPLWWRRLPSLLQPERREADADAPADPVLVERQWYRLGRALLLLLLFARWGYLAAGKIGLSEDEAYQWLWSKHPDLSYYSKPPLIAYAQWIGTHLAGDTELGVRLLSPLLGTVMGWILLGWLGRRTSARTAFWFLLAINATPLVAVGSILMTIDPLTVFFWLVALLATWRALSEDSTRWWLVTGLGWAGSFLSKYFSPFQWACLALFLIAWRPARRHLGRPGPWLALGINLLATVPVLLWNRRHDWITLTHLHERGGLDREWRFSLRFFWDFLIAEPALLNPVFFVLAILAAATVWRRTGGDAGRPPVEPWGRVALHRYLFCMGAPVFVFYLAYTLRARVQPNWIAVAILPSFLLAALVIHERWQAGRRAMGRWAVAGIALGLPLVVLLHDTNLVAKITGRPLPVSVDPLRRVRGHREMAALVGEHRNALLAEGRPVFLIADHYGRAGLMSFYLPEARAGVPDSPMVYTLRSDRPRNQFWFWPGYTGRHGDHALFVREIRGGSPDPLPPELLEDFRQVESRGVFPVEYRGRILRHVEIVTCRSLR